METLKTKHKQTGARLQLTRVARKATWLTATCGALFLAGCSSTPTLYQWGSYETQVYNLYNDPGKVPVEEQIEKLEANYQKARSANKAVPPGYHAHLGYLYFEAGKLDQALQSFQTEKALFPESAVFIDRMMARLKKP